MVVLAKEQNKNKKEDKGLKNAVTKGLREEIRKNYPRIRINDKEERLEIEEGICIKHTNDNDKCDRKENGYQTDILIYVNKNEDSKDDHVNSKEDDRIIPLVIIEVKGSKNITTDQIIAYSARAERHKRIYPWLRYGMIWNSKEEGIPFRFFKNNEYLDFAYNIEEDSKSKIKKQDKIREFYDKIIKDQIEVAKELFEIYREGEKDKKEIIKVYNSIAKMERIAKN